MYESPIEIIRKQMVTNFENQVLKAVQEVGVLVDKDELVKALQYDRGQYEKGYADGLLHRADEWISVDERLPENDARVLVYMHENRMSYTRIDTDRMVQGKWVRWETCVTHWMPLPEAPKGGDE